MATTTLPNSGLNTGYIDGNDSWGADMNRNLRILDALLVGRVQTRSLTAPPGSPTVGLVWLVAATATGAWAGQEGKLAVYATGDDLGSPAWIFIAPMAGMRVLVIDEDQWYVHDGSSWAIDYPKSVDKPGASETALRAEAGKYLRMSNAGTKTLTFDSSQNYVAGMEFYGRNVSGGTLSLAGTGVTLTGGTSFGPASSFKVKFTSTTAADVSTG